MNNKRTIEIKNYKLPITLTKEKEGGYSAVCDIWLDCFAQGETIKETIYEISQVANTLIDIYKEDNKKIPLPIKQVLNKKSSINHSIALSDK